MELLERLLHIDQELTLRINSCHSGISDNIMMMLSDHKVWIPLYAGVVAYLVYRLGWRRAFIVIVATALSFLFCDQLSNLSKSIFGRLRPCYSSYMLDNGLHMLEGRGGLYGFFSSHAANTIAYATCTSMGFRIDKSRKYHLYTSLIFIWAFAVGISRIFAGKHYLGDVLVGMIVGLVVGYLLSLFARWLCKKIEWRSSTKKASIHSSAIGECS